MILRGSVVHLNEVTLMAYKRGNVFWAWAYFGPRERKQISLDTDVKSLADEIERMLNILRSRRAWRLLRAVVKESTLTIGELFDAFREGDHALARVEAELNDVDLTQFIEGWQKWARRKASEAQIERYTMMLRALMPEGTPEKPIPFPRSRFVRRELSRALAAIALSGSTVRQYHVAWASFARYLVEIEVVPHNPLREVARPRANPPKELFLELPDVVRYVDAQAEPYRALAALREGAGVEVSAALALRVRDVTSDAMVVQAHGTKNSWRNRPAYVEAWARPYLVAACRGKLPDAAVFEGATYEGALVSHRAAVKALGLPEKYTMHDARHSFAVRWMRAGMDPNLIASNLGHKDATLVMKVYGKYRPRAVDFTKLEGTISGRGSFEGQNVRDVER